MIIVFIFFFFFIIIIIQIIKFTQRLPWQKPLQFFQAFDFRRGPYLSDNLICVCWPD